jgi:hypothetical protein
MSVFILSGAELRATMTMEGPVAPMSVKTGAELQRAMDAYTGNHDYGVHQFVQDVVDFEHLQAHSALLLEEDDDDLDTNEGDDTIEGMDMNSTDFQIKLEERRRRAQLAHARAREARKRREQIREETHKKVREEGEPFEATFKAESPGWYRACVKGTWYQVRK